VNRILIVDDEPFFREGLRRTICWRDLQACEPDEAINGLDALEKMESRPYDLVITDIRMPRMDGLELIEKASQLYPRTGFIVLSAYDEFRLVKKAFHLGIVDYLLKHEISQDELGRIIRRQSQCRREPEPFRTSGLEEYARKNETLVREMIIRNVIRGILPEKEAAEALGIPSAARGGRIYPAAARIHMPYQPEGEPESLKSRLGEILVSLTDRRPSLCAMGEDETVSLYLISTEPLDWAGLDRFWRELLEEWNRAAAPLDCHVSMGFSHRFSSFRSLDRYRTEAESCLSWFTVRGKGCLISPPRLQRPPGEPESLPCTGSLSADLNAGNSEKAAEVLTAMVLNPEKVRFCDPREILNYFSRIQAHVLTAGEQLNLTANSRFSGVMSRFGGRSGWDLGDYNRWLEDLADYFRSLNTLSNRNIIKAVELIGEVYYRDITLYEVAEQLELNPSYLSRLFSQELGIGFASYLARVRIREAVRMLESGNGKICEVGRAVGISQPETFCRVFKRVMGMSPQSYVQSVSKKLTH